MDVLEELRESGVARGDLVALVVAPEVGVAMATPAGRLCVPAAVDDPATVVRRGGGAPASMGDVVERHRGGARRSRRARRDRLGHRRGAAADLRRMARIRLACGRSCTTSRSTRSRRRRRPTCSAMPRRAPTTATGRQPDSQRRIPAARLGRRRLVDHGRAARRLGGAGIDRRRAPASTPGRAADRPRAVATARAESAAELLCAELSVDGLPMDRAVAEALIAAFVGARPRSEAEAAEQRPGATPRCCATHPRRRLRSPQPRAGEVVAAQRRRRGSRHARVEARGVARRASADRRAAHVAQGRARGDDVRLRVARRASRRRRSPARRGRDPTAPPGG